MGRNFFDAAHNDCPIVEERGKIFSVLIGNPTICPACRTLLISEIDKEQEIMTKLGLERSE